MNGSSTPPLLRVRALRKSFGAPVLRDMDLMLERGEVHALVGGNGAGKSTLARILAGLLDADAGMIELEGRPFAPKSRRAARAAGVTLMLQELNVLPTLTVAENLFLHDLPARFGVVDRRRLRERAARALARVGLDGLDPDTPAAGLGLGHQQLIELAGALEDQCRLLILDEPTAALTSRETERLFTQMDRLRSAGVGVLLVSHRMEELRRIADRVSVLRDGERVATRRMAETNPAELVRLMAGRDQPMRPPPRRRPPGRVVLQVKGLQVPPLVHDVSFEVREGEIVGLGGLVGAGRTESLRAIFGADPALRGSIEIGGRRRAPRSPTEAVAAGIALVPEDRKTQGLLLPCSLRVNTTLSALNGILLDEESERRVTTDIISRLAVKCESPEQPVARLSGGNQQKIVIGRWLLRDSRVLLLDEPTRGVDVPARERIHDLLRELAEDGRAIVVVSSELSELMSLCDRIVVLSAGRSVAEFASGDWDEARLTDAAFRNQRAPAAD